jgi:hypothetical protein
MNTKILIGITVVAIIAIILVVAFSSTFPSVDVVQNGTSTQPVATSTNNTNTASSTVSDLIRVTYPKVDDQISSPLVVNGEARGGYFSEAVFPVVLTDLDGKIIAQGLAHADGEWMTNNFVSFTATLNFSKPAGTNLRGFLILKKDNPSGLPENDASLEIPVYFK